MMKMGFTKQISKIGLLITLFISISAGQDTESSVFFVDPNIKLVKFEGWGTSLAWFGDLLGGMDQSVFDEIMDGLFSPSRLNLNIVRYAIGGTTPNNYTCGGFRPGAAQESYRDGFEYNYDWTRDPRQRKVLQRGKELGVDTFEAFSNTPPQWLTITGCSKGNSGGGIFHVNFDPYNAEAFAIYVADIITHFHENWNITFQTYAPFNEPSTGGWFGEGQQQEGCNFNRKGLLAVLQAVNHTFTAKGMDYVSISAFDETGVNFEQPSQHWLASKGMTHLISKVNTHGYWDLGVARRDRLYSSAQRYGQRLWMDEVGWAASFAEDMTQGLTLAKRIVRDLRQLIPSAWLYWQAMEDEGMWGLVDIPYKNATLENVRYNTGYFAMMQFSKYIRKGLDIIYINENSAIAAYDDVSKTLVAVAVNTDLYNPRPLILDLGLFRMEGQVYAWRTSPTEQNSPVTPPPVLIPEKYQLKVNLIPASITTIVISNTSALPMEYPNLILNGEFEDERGNNGWISSNPDGVYASATYARSGNFSGVIIPQSKYETGWLRHPLELKHSKRYYLVAWCASGGSTTAELAVESSNGTVLEEVRVEHGYGYHSYGLSFFGNAGDTISVVFKSSTPKIPCYVDDVTIH